MILLIRSKVNHDGFPKCIMHESSALATRFRKLESFETADGNQENAIPGSLYTGVGIRIPSAIPIQGGSRGEKALYSPDRELPFVVRASL